MRSRGFTIVELLIVIVVIGILAGIVIVAFNGVRQNAGEAVLQADLRSATTDIEQEWLTEGSYPSNVSGVERSPGTVYEYTGETNYFCITASSQNAQTSFYYDSDDPVIREGACPGHEGSGEYPSVVYDVGDYYGCFYTTALYCFGDNDVGQLGNGTTIFSTTPLPVSTTTGLGNKQVTSIDTGLNTTCAVADGEIFCWGDTILTGEGHVSSMFGTGTDFTNDVLEPLAVNMSGPIGTKNIIQVTTSSFHTCAIADDGSAFCWGLGSTGALGDGLNTTSNLPVEVDRSGAMNGASVTNISAGNGPTCAVAGGKVYCWGGSLAGDLVSGNYVASSVPVEMNFDSSVDNVAATKVSVSTYGSACALFENGEVHCWGLNTGGRFANASATVNQRTNPVKYDSYNILGGEPIVDVGAGYVNDCVVSSGRAYCSGLTWLGNGTSNSSPQPVEVLKSGGLENKQIVSVSVGEAVSCVEAEGALYCWGNWWAQGNGGAGPAHILAPEIILGF